eukprot:m.155654 g.155654  ORF g.155654 m.155654 type:complete len:61 (-) comp24660_c0_seq5:46-228(-)
MFGGILVQLTFDRYAKPGVVDRGSCERLSGIALEFTVISAVMVGQVFWCVWMYVGGCIWV